MLDGMAVTAALGEGRGIMLLSVLASSAARWVSASGVDATATSR
jgi:hypothetical protein